MVAIYNKRNPATGQAFTLSELRALHAYEEFRKSEGLRLLPEYTRQHHVSHRRLQVEFQGHLVKVMLRGGVPKTVPAKRGVVSGFSPQSRSRLMEKFARFKRPAHTSFVTLTYGADFPMPDEAKGHLRAFLERIRRRGGCEKASGVWRIELQDRGAPHFHILFFDLPYIRKETVQEMWAEIIKQERPFTRIEAVRSWNGIMSYCSKYIAKPQEPVSREGDDGFIYLTYLHDMGRVWGIFNKHNLPYAALTQVIFPMFPIVFTKFRHIAELVWPGLGLQEAPGFKLFVFSADHWIPIWNKCANIEF